VGQESSSPASPSIDCTHHLGGGLAFARPSRLLSSFTALCPPAIAVWSSSLSFEKERPAIAGRE
jgi:hypothetical protein